MTVNAANVTDVDADDPPDQMLANFVLNFTVAADIVCGDPSTLISAIQGTGATSPMTGSIVEIEGVVVGAFPGADTASRASTSRRRTTDRDADPATSEGIFVFEPNGGATYTVGDVVRVRGRVTEFDTSDVTLTELDKPEQPRGCSSGAICHTDRRRPAVPRPGTSPSATRACSYRSTRS